MSKLQFHLTLILAESNLLPISYLAVVSNSDAFIHQLWFSLKYFLVKNVSDCRYSKKTINAVQELCFHLNIFENIHF